MRFFSLLTILFFGIASGLMSQTPQVPSRMEFAGIKLKIQESGRKDIQESVDALTRSQTHYNIMIEKARSYFPIIERIFKEEDVPVDFKYLVLQESGLEADAVSSSNAVGYWQFKDFTAMEMGLRVDRHIDERMNIVAATRAAARYIKKNNTFFDNWLHALQAYQMGAGGAMRVLKDASGAKSMTVDKNTYWYVKKFLAHKVAYENVVEGSPQLKLSEYKNGAGKNLRDIAKEVKIKEEELTAYNKWLRKGRIPDDKTYTVIIPSDQFVETVDHTRVLAKNTQNDKEPTASTTINYQFVDKDLFPRIEREPKGFARINGLPGIIAKEGEKVADLAERGNVALSRFLKYNDIDIDHHVKEGDYFYLRKKRAKAGTHYHVLQPGQDLWEVSQKYGVRFKKLLFKNRIRTDEPELKAGRVLWLRYVRPARIEIAYKEVEKPTPMLAKNKPEKENSIKTEEPNEIEVQDSVVLNIYPLAPPKYIEKAVREEERTDLLTKQSSEESASQPESLDSVKRIHSVKPGETYYAISNKYNTSVMELLDWNNLHINDKLAIGQKLIVYEHIPAEGNKIEKKSEKAPYIYYTVKPGDTLYKIARSYEITVEELMNMNEKSDFSLNLGERIKVGRKTLSD